MIAGFFSFPDELYDCFVKPGYVIPTGWQRLPEIRALIRKELTPKKLFPSHPVEDILAYF